MKRMIPVFIAVLMLFSGCVAKIEENPNTQSGSAVISTEATHSEVPRILSFHSVEAYNELLSAVDLNEEGLQAYLYSKNYDMNGITTRDDILGLSKIMASVPFPDCEMGELEIFEINMDLYTVFLRYRTNAGNTLQFRISLNRQSAKEDMSAAIHAAGTAATELAAKNMESLYYTGVSQRAAAALTYAANVDGYYVMIEVFDASRESIEQNIQAIAFGSMGK